MAQKAQAPAPDAARTLAVIPARYGSGRLPAKVLAEIGGQTMLERVWRQAARASTVDRVLIATDDGRVRRAALTFAPEADIIMTSPELASGSDRVAEIAGRNAAAIYINVQADMPLLDPRLIDTTVALLEESEEFDIATAAVPLADSSELDDPDVVKVTVTEDGRALDFFRTPDAATDCDRPHTPCHHVGIYAFRRDTLLRFRALQPSPLEHTRRLEQLRALENGIAIGVALLDISGHLSVDSARDLETARRALEASGEPEQAEG